MNAESARRIGHPAPFPEELPYRLIQLYSFTDDIILDPFMGSGTTGVSALKSNRKYVGYDISQEYIDLANKRLEPLKQQTNIFDNLTNTINATTGNKVLAKKGQTEEIQHL